MVKLDFPELKTLTPEDLDAVLTDLEDDVVALWHDAEGSDGCDCEIGVERWMGRAGEIARIAIYNNTQFGALSLLPAEAGLLAAQILRAVGIADWHNAKQEDDVVGLDVAVDEEE